MKLPGPEDRLPILYTRRDLKMARSAHAYVRGNTALFYEWLTESSASAMIPNGPPVWICGDCHLGNLGPLADGEGRVAIQIRDLDQAVIGNPAHDLIRLGLSLVTAARGSDLPGVTMARMVEQMIEGYEQAIAEFERGDVGDEPDLVRTVRRRALGRKWRHLARERLEDVKPSIPLGKRFWPLQPAEQSALEKVVEDPVVSGMILPLDQRGEQRVPSLVDAAYWMKGCSSLGLQRFAAIVALKGEKRTDYALIDLKEAVAPVAPASESAQIPDDPAQRVVIAARALSPFLGSRIAATNVLDRSMFVRELTPKDMKIEVGQFSSGEAMKASRYLAFVVGKAHARQMDRGTRSVWLRELQRGRKGALNAPSWLWRAILALSAKHEEGYLEHCRIYALAESRN
jgi:uncharacterized protein (DUF2252 family)